VIPAVVAPLLSRTVLFALAMGCLTAALPAQSPAPNGGVLDRRPYDLPFATHAAWLAFMAGSPEQPDLAMLTEAYPVAEFEAFARGDRARAEQIVYTSGALRIRGMLIRPTRPGPHPVVIYNRGGNREFGRVVFLDVLRMLTIAQHGYIVVAAEYRGENGSEGDPVLGGGDVDDVLALLPLLDALPDADANRIAMIGWSRGGLVTYHALSRSNRIRAAVILAGAADLLDDARRRPALDSVVFAASVPGYAANRERALRTASAMDILSGIPDTTAILLLHGTADDRVHPSVTLRVSAVLLEAGISHRLVMLERGSHSLLNHATTVRHAIEDWLEQHLRQE